MAILVCVTSCSERVIDVLKIDCEACEWGAFATWFGEGAPVIRQVMIELHEGTYARDRARPIADEFFRFMRSKGYVVFHKEPNTLGCRCGVRVLLAAAAAAAGKSVSG